MISCWLSIIFWLVYQHFQEGFRADSWNVLSTSHVFLLGRQILVLLSWNSSLHSLHLMFAMLIVIVYIPLSFWFYWCGLQCILVVIFGICSLWVFLSFIVAVPPTISKISVLEKKKKEKKKKKTLIHPWRQIIKYRPSVTSELRLWITELFFERS